MYHLRSNGFGTTGEYLNAQPALDFVIMGVNRGTANVKWRGVRGAPQTHACAPPGPWVIGLHLLDASLHWK